MLFIDYRHESHQRVQVGRRSSENQYLTRTRRCLFSQKHWWWGKVCGNNPLSVNRFSFPPNLVSPVASLSLIDAGMGFSISKSDAILLMGLNIRILHIFGFRITVISTNVCSPSFLFNQFSPTITTTQRVNCCCCRRRRCGIPCCHFALRGWD